MHKNILLLLALAGAAALAATAQAQRGQLGSTPTSQELQQENITVLPDGTGLPPGQGTAAQGETVYRSRCAACHGADGEKAGAGPQLVGGSGTLTSANPVKTIGSYWPYATTIWDYIHRAMPYDRPGSLTADEIYSLTAYLLYRNHIVERDQVISEKTLPQVRMPNHDGFIPDGRPDIGRHAASPPGR